LGSGFPEKLVLNYRRFDAQIVKPASNTEVVVSVTPESDAAAKVKKSSEGALLALNHEIPTSPLAPVFWNQRPGGESRQVFEIKRVTGKVFIC
jgi:hypothetical protein